MSKKSNDPQSSKPDRYIAVGSALSGFFAFVGASCCVLPLVLINLGISSALVGKFVFFARAQPYFLGGAVVLLVAAFIATFRKGRRPSKRMAIFLFLATMLIAAAYLMPSFEGQLLRWINQ